MKIRIDHIDRAVRANFVISKFSAKPLQALPIGSGTQSSSIARLVFMGAALENGFGCQKICEHLDMTLFEYHSKLIKYQESLKAGRLKMEQLKQGSINYDKALVGDGDLRLYRKVILVKNYIRNLQLEAFIST